MVASTQRVKAGRAPSAVLTPGSMATNRSTLLTVLLSLGLTACCMTACGGEEAATSAPPATETPAPPAEARASWTEPNFTLVGTAPAPVAAGAPATFEVVLTPLGAYHVNREYPWTVSVTGPDGVTLPQPTLESGSAAEMTDTIARFNVPFTASAAGTHHLVANVDFGICTDEGCQFETRAVAVDVTAN